MKIALKHIFQKHWFVIVGVLTAWILCKYFAVNALEQQADTTYKVQWITEMSEMDIDERELYLAQVMDELYTKTSTQESETSQNGPVATSNNSNNSKNTTAGQASSVHPNDLENALKQYWQLYADHQNQKELSNLITFGQNKQGAVPVILPANYLDLLDFYAQMEEPSLINEVHLDIYFNLQEASIIPILAFFMLAVYFSIQYETQIYQYAQTTPKGKTYNKQLKLILLSLIFLLLTVNEAFDLLFSGVIFDQHLLQASLQSYSYFANTQTHAHIGEWIFFVFLAKILGTLVICQLTELIAWGTKNMKDTMVGGAFLFLFLYLFTQTLESSKLLPLIQIGMVNWENVISHTKICVPLGISYTVIGFGVTLLTFIVTILLSKKCLRKV